MLHSLFCALRPPAELARELWDEFAWLRADEDRVEPERLHVTLAPLGVWRQRPDALIERARSACASLEVQCFRVVFDEVVVGDRLLLKPSEAVPALDRFHHALTRRLSEAGLPFARSHRFSPHLTASYRLRNGGRIFVPPVSWMVREFVLIESLIGRRTQIDRGRWALQ